MNKLVTTLMLLITCNIASSDIFVMQQEDILGTWTGTTKVESQVQQGYYTDIPVLISIKDRNTSRYSLGDTLDFCIQEQIYKGQYALIYIGYLTNLKEEYGPTLEYTFSSSVPGTILNLGITITQLSTDSLKVLIGPKTYQVGK
jgi:hypothetical protein